MSKAISRRDFMKVTGAVGAAGLLAACGGNSAASGSAPPLLPLPLLLQTRAWHCLTALFP